MRSGMFGQDTIAAQITAQGTGAMGALRLSGPRAFDAVSRVFRSKNGRDPAELHGYSLTFGGVYVDGAFLDQALLLKMAAPNSLTGEHVAELQCHGGAAVLHRLLGALTSLPDLPVRPAEPGEFSLRAYLNGKMDLSQAEAVMELVTAGNAKAASIAASQIEGALSAWIRKLRDGLLRLLAEIEAELDFPDEALGEMDTAARREACRLLLGEAEGLVASAERGGVYREGIRVVFFGRPNAGKSSLLNGILREPRAIVTPEPGTTRDVLEERVLLRGLPLVLTDTAGIREAGSLAERAGVDRARAMAAGAALTLYVVDLQVGLTPEDESLLRSLDREKTMIVLNKLDLAPLPQGAEPSDFLPEAFKDWPCCSLCALDPAGLDVLAESIRVFLDGRSAGAQQGELLLNRRQHDALLQARQALSAAVEVLAAGLPEDIATIDLKQAWTYLGELTGESLQPALVETIFSTFCLGK